MVDEIFDRTYQNGRAELNAGIARGFAKLGSMLSESFAVLHRIEWSAPWHRQGTRA
ncbi:MAG TPA: hypothetical protein VJM15_08970 [Sphingomicrobium sp.]|nr:hypothetical protein [Sphingomicrobium sp.]